MTVRSVWVVAGFLAGALAGCGVGLVAGYRAGLRLSAVDIGNDIGKVLDALEAQYDISLIPATPAQVVERPGALRVIGIIRKVLVMVTGQGRAEA